MAIPDQELAKPGCFSRFLSLLLCSHYSHNPPPIYPETEDTLSLSLNKQPPNPMLDDDSTIPNSTTPGLVARLMGLDSLPNTSKRVAPDLVSRSKSVNFLDYLLRFDPTHEEQPNHRRVRTSSFREVPPPFSASFNNPQDDLVVFLWDEKSDNVGPSITRKSEEKEKEKKKKKISKLKNEPRRECGASSSSRRESSREKYKYKEPKFRKRAVRNDKSLNKTENNQEYYASSTQNLSPVSVLDVDIVGGGDDEFMFTNQPHFSGDANARPLCVKWKRNSSGGILSLDEVVEETGLGSSINVNDDGNYGYNNEELEGVMKKSETEYWSELMGKLVSLTESDIRKSDWRLKKKSMFQSDTSAFYEISFMFERKILDLLLRELVHELVQF